jgi:hypothetical protein
LLRAFSTVVLSLGCVCAVAQTPELELDLTHRSRFESLDPQFRPGYPSSDQVLALRTNLRVDAVWPRLRLTAELLDSRIELNDIDAPTSTAIVNTLEPIQLSATWDLAGRDSVERSMLTLGWLTKDIGGRRLIARNRFRNTPNAFAGVDWFWRNPGGTQINVFYLHPVQRLPETPRELSTNVQQRDDVTRDTAVAGFHVQSWLADGKTLGEVLLLRSDGPDRRAPDSGSHDLMTLSLRASRPPTRGAWDFEVEAAFQDGTSRLDGSPMILDNRAHFLHLSAGYTLDTARRPRVVAQYDYASGDEVPFDARMERFDTLYGARSFELGPSGIYGPFVRGNLESIGVRGALQLTPRWNFMATLRGFWLASKSDEWIAAELQDQTGQSGDYIGRQLESWLAWDALPERLTLQLGVAHLRFGRFALTVPGATGRTHSTYLYGQLTYQVGAKR